MKLWIKLLLAGVIGFGGGFASGFLVHKKMNDVQFEEISDEEMAEIENKVNEANQEEKTHEPFDPVNLKDIPEDPDKLRNALQGKTPYMKADEEQKKAYEKLWNATKEYSDEENANDIPTKPEEDEEEEDLEDGIDEDFVNQLDEEEENNDFEEPPHPIQLSDYYNDRPEYDKITVTWFEPDDTWIDEKEEIIGDILDYIGMEKVRELFASNKPDEDPDVRYIRNDGYKTDYEIVRYHRSWREATGGVE